MPKKNNRSGSLLSRNIRILRQISGLTQEMVAELTNIQYKYYQSIEGDVKTNLQLKTMDKLANVFGVSTSEIISETPPNQQVINAYDALDYPMMKAAEDPPEEKHRKNKAAKKATKKAAGEKAKKSTPKNPKIRRTERTRKENTPRTQG